MEQQTGTSTLKVDDLVVDPGARMLWRDGARIELPRLSFDLLLALVEAAPDALSTDQLLERVWGGVLVSPATIAKRVELLRQALDDDAAEPRYVELVRGYGYRLATSVSEISPENPARPAREPQVAADKGLRGRLAWWLAALVIAALALYVGWQRETPAPERSIAVLPFQAVGDSNEDRWFAEGLTEETTHALARTGQLLVAGRASAFSPVLEDAQPQAIGQALGVANLLEGSVRREGGRLRVTVRLIETSRGFQLWSETFEAPSSSALSLQQMIARQVAGRLQLNEPPAASAFSSGTSNNPGAYALYLQAVSLSPYPAGVDLPRAQALIEQVVEIDPGFAPGWNRLAAIHGRRLFFDPTYPLTPPDAIRIIREALDRALAIDPNIGEAYANLAGLAWVFDHDMVRAAGLLEQAVRLDPWNLEVLTLARDFVRAIGDLQLSREIGAYILDRDPFCVSCRTQYAGTLTCLGDLEEARQQLKVLERDDSGVSVQHPLGILSLLAGDLRQASLDFEREANPALRLSGQVLLAHARGDDALAQAQIDELLAMEPAAVWPVGSETAAMLGKSELALDLLEPAEGSRFVFLQGLVCSPTFDGLRNQPRWQALMLKLGFKADGSQAVPFSLPPVPGMNGSDPNWP